MAKKAGKANHRKGSKAAPKLETQARGNPNPPTEGIYDPQQPQQQKQVTMADAVKDWFKQAKDVARPDGVFMGIKDEMYDPKDFSFGINDDKNPK